MNVCSNVFTFSVLIIVTSEQCILVGIHIILWFTVKFNRIHCVGRHRPWVTRCYGAQQRTQLYLCALLTNAVKCHQISRGCTPEHCSETLCLKASKNQNNKEKQFRPFNFISHRIIYLIFAG